MMSAPKGKKLAVLLFAAMPGLGQAEPQWVGRFISSDGQIPPPWMIEQLDARVPPTRYRMREWDGVPAVEAHAQDSMALLARPVEVDLERTPVLCWRWRIDAPVASADMMKKAGDDYAARVYLTFEVAPDQLSISTRTKLGLARSVYGKQVPDAAVNYVWDNKYPVGTIRDNAYTDRARMFVLRSDASHAGRWINERRNVRDDFRRAFGPLSARLGGLAIASDTDNTGGVAHAGFADFRFVERDAECPLS